MTASTLSTTGLDLSCLRRRAGLPASHDNLFSTVLGVFDVQSASHVPGRDLLAACRGPGSGGGARRLMARP